MWAISGSDLGQISPIIWTPPFLRPPSPGGSVTDPYLIIDRVALAKPGDNALGSVRVSELS